jgi:cytochrome c oxidase subunit 2
MAALAWLAAAAGTAFAQEGSAPARWETNFQEPATRVMEYLVWFGWYTLFIVSLIVVLVIGLLAWCAWKFNERSNPVPSRVTHNTTIEVLWTVLPVLVLVAIAIPSFRLLYAQYDPSKLYPDFDPKTTKVMNVKVTGVQWSWNVDYSNDEDSVSYGVAEPISLSMFMIDPASLAPGQMRNLSVDNPMVVPVNTFVRVQVTAEGDAIHAFAMPAFGVKVDAVPGRLNGTYFKAEREGTFYGQCSELCGKDHAFMPFNIVVVSPERFREWAQAAPSDLTGAYQKLAEELDSDKKQKQLAAAEPVAAKDMPRN